MIDENNFARIRRDWRKQGTPYFAWYAPDKSRGIQRIGSWTALYESFAHGKKWTEKPVPHKFSFTPKNALRLVRKLPWNTRYWLHLVPLTDEESKNWATFTDVYPDTVKETNLW